MMPEPVEARLLANTARFGPYWLRADEDNPGDCWLWQLRPDTHGYGQLRWRVNGVPGSRGAHVAMFELYRGPVPDGLELDHWCHNEDPTCHGGLCYHRLCVNPWHVEPVTPKENVRRSPHHNGSRTHCPQGHPYDEANTYTNPQGKRECRTCNRDDRQRYAAKIANQQPTNQETR